MSASTLLEAQGLVKQFGGLMAVNNVSLQVQRGALHSIIGLNGVGKTTLFNLLSGYLKPTAGHVLFKGHDLTRVPTHRIAHLGVGYCPEERGIFASLSVEENLVLPPAVRSGGMSVEELYAMFPNLAERRKSQGTRLSGGEQQMLAMARILRTGANLLLLDEITEGLAPVIVQRLGEVLTLLKSRGYTVILVEQNFRFAAPLADRHYVIEHGRVVDTLGRAELPAKMEALHQRLGV